MINIPKLAQTIAAVNNSGLRIITNQSSFPSKPTGVESKPVPPPLLKTRFQDDPFFTADVSPLANPQNRELQKPPISFVKPASQFMYSPGPMTRQRSIKTFEFVP